MPLLSLFLKFFFLFKSGFLGIAPGQQSFRVLPMTGQKLCLKCLDPVRLASSANAFVCGLGNTFKV